MDIDEKKRKIEEVIEPANLDVDTILKSYLDITKQLLQLVAVLSQKVVGFEAVFNKDLFQKK